MCKYTHWVLEAQRFVLHDFLSEGHVGDRSLKNLHMSSAVFGG